MLPHTEQDQRREEWGMLSAGKTKRAHMIHFRMDAKVSFVNRFMPLGTTVLNRPFS